MLSNEARERILERAREIGLLDREGGLMVYSQRMPVKLVAELTAISDLLKMTRSALVIHLLEKGLTRLKTG